MSLFIASPVLDIATIAELLGKTACRFDIDVLPACDSTNAELLARAEHGAASGTVIAAEHQTGGRGRRGRRWISAPGESLTFSVLWRFRPGTIPMGLSLAAGVAVINGLLKAGAPEGAGPIADNTALRLKWPNDVLLNGRKLAGILVELVPGATHAVVLGIGINLNLPPGLPEELRGRAAALGADTNMNAILASILRELHTVLERFGKKGFSSLRDEWTALHAFENTPVSLSNDFSPPRSGICRGVDDDGALLFDTGDQVERILSGEISLRPCP